MIKWDEIVHFKEDEFVHPELLRPAMIYMLDDVRSQVGEPLVVTSSYRDPMLNMGVGGVKDSAHLPDPKDGFYSGIDIITNSGRMSSNHRYRILIAALNTGFTRIGLYPKHAHLDIEKRLPIGVVWIGTD